MAITLAAEQKYPATDDANDTTAAITLDKDASGWITLTAGAFIFAWMSFKAGSSSTSVTTDGGQTWTEEVDANTASFAYAAYSCVFNGTWNADPVFTNTGTAGPACMWAMALVGVNATTQWDVTPVFTTQAASTTFVEATFDTVTDGAWAFVGAHSLDNNTWTVDNSFVAPSGSGNIYWRSSGGTDESVVLARREFATAGAVGTTTMTQATLGADAGSRFHAAVRPAPAATAVVPAHLPFVQNINHLSPI